MREELRDDERLAVPRNPTAALRLEEREQLAESVEELARDTPQQDVAVVRVKRIIGKIGGAAREVLVSALVKVATAEAKAKLGLPLT